MAPLALPAQDLDAPNAIRIFYTNVPPHLLATQINLSAGTGRITKTDKPLLSVSGEVKGMYNLTGAIYVSTGGGLSYLRSQERVQPGEDALRRSSLLFYLPSGIGFTMGDDHASFITGLDILPGFYLHESPELPDKRLFALGFGPEFGFLFRAGPRYTKGLLLGMVGKVQFMQLPDATVKGIRYTYAGLGFVVRFY